MSCNCKWKRGRHKFSQDDNVCRKHAPVVVNDTRRVRGEDFNTTYPDALCPCGDYECEVEEKQC